MEKIRLDVLLTERGYAPSRERAKALIMEGVVYVNGVKEDKPGTAFVPDKITSLEVRDNPLPYVSRGGLKLAKAVDLWEIGLKDMVCMDIGASTGGFTDVMLRHGAKKVYAVDSGYGQLDYRLRTDARVICMEKTNFRYVTEKDIPETIDFAGADVSFISLTKILPAAHALLGDEAYMVCLIKPQFEAGRDKVGKKGVVRDKTVHEEVIVRIMRDAAKNGFCCKGLTFSPVRGPEGNIEYLLYLQKTSAERKETDYAGLAHAVTEEAHSVFGGHT